MGFLDKFRQDDRVPALFIVALAVTFSVIAVCAVAYHIVTVLYPNGVSH